MMRESIEFTDVHIIAFAWRFVLFQSIIKYKINKMGRKAVILKEEEDLVVEVMKYPVLPFYFLLVFQN